MNKQLKNITRAIFVIFIVLFGALTTVQVVNADALRANPLNERTLRNSFNVERGSILVGGDQIVFSEPSNDTYKFIRKYANGQLYAPVTGYFSHYQGATGIEQALNEELSGAGGNQFFTRITRIISGQDPQGSSVELTLDAKAQQAAYEGLQGMKGGVVAMDAKTGEILALASTPSYDPGLLASNDSSEIIANYNELEKDPEKPLYNRAIGGDTYQPGSVFKLVTVAAALESGKYTATSTVNDPATLTLPGSSSEMKNATLASCDGGDKVSIEIALIRSCNIPFAQIAMDLPDNAITDMAAAFGFDKSVDIPLTSTPSTVGQPTDDAQRALTAIGQYDVRATPLQMAMVAAAITNDGEQVKPALVSSIIGPDLRTEYTHEPETLATPISEKTASSLKAMMVKGVTDGTGLARQAAIDGVTVGGKTGTAQTGTDENGNDLPYNLWFTGFAETAERTIVVAVLVEESGGSLHNFSGNSSTVPTIIGKQVMEAVLSE